MNKGYVISAQNSGTVDYIHCARTLCHNIKNVMPGANVTLLTDKQIDPGPFDNVVLYPYGDNCVHDTWKLANDWQVYWASPYDHTIKLEADLYLPRTIDHWWSILEPHPLVICSTMRNHRNEISTNRYYRRIFDTNKLPDVYNAITYFKRSSTAEHFFSLVRDIFGNWGQYKTLLRGADGERATTDVVYAIAAKIIGVESCTLPQFTDMSLIHMKQEIIGSRGSDWTRELLTEITPWSIRVETVPQLYPFHYHIKNFAKELQQGQIE